MKRFELNENEKALICSILGYLNFSSGCRDVQFIKTWDALYKDFSERGSTEIWRDSVDALKEELPRLEAAGGAFVDSTQAKKVLDLIGESLEAYREFHRDVLFSLDNSYLFNSFFMSRLCDVITRNDPLTPDKAKINKIIVQLNDYLGYRPIPVLEGGEKHEPNKHEWISPLPIYIEGVGTAFGKYHNVVEIALEILKDTDSSILSDASFIPEKLRELAVDTRAYDYDHPVNRRLNYSFGTWDDRCIDKEGYFRRFILQRATLDAIMSRVQKEEDPVLRKEYEYEAAAILAGTMLMGSAVSGGHVQAHDSSVTLSSLTPIIALFRDEFYEKLLAKTPDPIKTRLEEEKRQFFQPFAGSRQYLNQYLAQKRADQLQRFSLARTYARMGYFEASKRQTEVIETSASRLLSQIDCYITQSHLSADSGALEDAAACMPKIEELLRRGLACGAFPDPWFILGFDAQFNLFPTVEDGVHDHRLDGLIDLLNDIFDLYSRLQKEAAAAGKTELRLELSDQMSSLADWWDQFGSTEVSSVDGFSGQDAWESAAEVSSALAVWSQAGKAIGDVAFWKRHVNRFKTPKAFVLLCEALLDKNDLISTSSLLIYWLNQSSSIPLVEGDYSFHSVVFDWMEKSWSSSEELESPSLLRRRRSDSTRQWSVEEYLKRWGTTTKFMDFFGENADSYWSIPSINLPKERFDRKISLKTDNPVIAELTRRLLLSVRYSGKTATGIPKISLKASFRDAARSVEEEALFSPEEFRKFYADNQKVFPKYLTFQAFMQIVLNEVPMSPHKLTFYRKEIFGDTNKSFSVSNPTFSVGNPDKGGADIDESEDSKKKLLSELNEELKSQNVDSLDDFIERLLSKMDEGKSKEGDLSVNTNVGNEHALIVRIDDWDSDSLDSDDYEEEFDEDAENDSDEHTITGGDSRFSAAYEHMSYHDTADDGVDDDIAGSKSKFQEGGNDLEFGQETDRISERLTFIISTVKLWKFAAGRSPQLTLLDNGSLDDDVLSEARLRLEEWRDQALKFETGLYELLDQASRLRIPRPSGTTESLVEYDQIRGTKEILLDRIIWTIVEVEDVIVFLKATLRDETTEKYAKPWKSAVLETFSAIFRRDVKRVRLLWPQLLSKLETETLLYIPTSRGGDAKAIVERRRLQQVVLSLLRYTPRLGLLRETFQLISCVQKMEQIRLSSPGSITEYDRLVETATRSITESLSESSKKWRVDRSLPDYKTRDHMLVDYLADAIEIILKHWLSHSQQIRVSSVEALSSPQRWRIVKSFIQNYGSGLFTQEFLSFRSLRAILHQGTQNYLSSLVSLKKSGYDLEIGDRLVTAIVDGKENLENVAATLEIIIECVAENYMEYVDYNSTTIQSDRGENLYILLDFFRTLCNYERTSWNLKPIYWIHDSLIRSERPEAARLWKEDIKQKSSGLAENGLREYAELCQKYGVRLQCVYQRLSERFVRPLDIAQMCGLVFDSISAVRKEGENNPIFEELSKEVETFASSPSGNGFELPEWLTTLQDEVVLSRVDSKEERRENDSKEDPFESIPFLPIERLSRSEIEEQLHSTVSEFKGQSHKRR